MALVLGNELIRIEWCENESYARMLAESWMNGARAAQKIAGFQARVPSVFLPTVDDMEKCPDQVRVQIELAIQEA